MRWANIATIVAAAVLVVGIVAYNYYDVMWMSDVGQHSDMRLLAYVFANAPAMRHTACQ